MRKYKRQPLVAGGPDRTAQSFFDGRQIQHICTGARVLAWRTPPCMLKWCCGGLPLSIQLPQSPAARGPDLRRAASWAGRVASSCGWVAIYMLPLLLGPVEVCQLVPASGRSTSARAPHLVQTASCQKLVLCIHPATCSHVLNGPLQNPRS